MAGVDAGGGSRGVVCVLFMVLCGSQLVLNASYFMEAITEENNKVHDHTSKNVKVVKNCPLALNWLKISRESEFFVFHTTQHRELGEARRR